MSSDSEELTPAPRDESRDALIAGALRKAVADTFKKNRDDVTLRYIRTLVEDQLTLGAQFFKSDDYWKNQSKDIVLQEVDIQTANAEAPASPEKKKPARKPARKPAAKKAKEPTLDNDGDEEPKPPKRARAAKSTEKKSAPKRARAKSKTTVEDKSEAEEASKPVSEPAANNESGLEDEPPKKKRAKKNEAKQSASPKASPKKAGKVGAIETVKKDTTPAIAAVGSTPGDESEMSEVLDIPPPSPKKRSRGRSSTGETKKGGAPSKSKKEKPAAKNLSPDEEKIKSLQGWLLKCGIRKIWTKELAKFNTSKEKTQHLKSLLTEVGMAGQYSLAKAKKIKEDRELAAEVAAVQQGASDWGNETGRRKLIRGTRPAAEGEDQEKTTSRAFHDLDFLGDQSDDDSD